MVDGVQEDLKGRCHDIDVGEIEIPDLCGGPSVYTVTACKYPSLGFGQRQLGALALLMSERNGGA